MPHWIIYLIAVVSTTAFVLLWFWEVRRILQEQKHIVDSARQQLSVFSKKSLCDRNDPEIRAILERSRNIYCQSVAHYNATLRKPWVYLPAKVMGFQKEEPK